ncbi:MAG: hypothetical protein R2787_06385 [Saprospiraceae bacterium]
MKFIILILFVTISTLGRTQEVNMDSILNDYERKFRVELNRSDTLLINELLEKLDDNCQIFSSLVESKRYSNTFIIELTKRMVNKGICIRQVVDKIEYYFPVDELGISSGYPVYYGAIVNKDGLTRIRKYLIESDYLLDCQFLLGRSIFTVKLLSYILNQTTDPIGNYEQNCRGANLMILDKYYRK